jgi:hypothetical protein
MQGVGETMTNPKTHVAASIAAKIHRCYSCGGDTSIDELRAVDILIERSPFFAGISENFSWCDGEDDLFHDNIVNCCISCYDHIIEGVALFDDAVRQAEIANIARAMRSRRKEMRLARVAITLESLWITLVRMSTSTDLAGLIDDGTIQEALYCRSGPHCDIF